MNHERILDQRIIKPEIKQMEYFILYAPIASAIFALTLITSLVAFYNDRIYGNFMLHPYSVSRGERVYTLITSGLIHRDWSHLLFNMVSYYFFAFKLEFLMGHWQFALLYVASLILSDMPSVIKHKDHFGYHSLGASGAISAVVFGYIMFDPTASMYLMFIPIGIPAIIFGILYLCYCYYASRYSHDAINHDAHLFGAICGILITVLLVHNIVPSFIEKLQQFHL